MAVEQVPDIPMFRQNTAAFVHDLPAGSLSNVDGDTNYVRIQVLTNAGALDRGKQLAVVEQLTRIAAEAAGDPTLASRTWVLLTEAPDGGWGLNGHANTNEELVAVARAPDREPVGRQAGRRLTAPPAGVPFQAAYLRHAVCKLGACLHVELAERFA
jgi:phenylpyruvate tautomerase PptA (4-oxalocrotonate tautomerase family)